MDNRGKRPVAGHVRAIVFDKDGTLIDFDRTWAPVIRSCAELASAGDPALGDRLMAACGFDSATGRTMADSVLAAGNTVEIADAMVRAGSPFAAGDLVGRFDRLFAAAAEHAVPLTDIRALFARLRDGGLAIGVASSDNEQSIRRTLEILGVADAVTFVAGYDSGYGHKPGPGMVLEFCRQTGIPAEAVAVAGDNRHDLAMGRAARAGLVIGVLTGTGTREGLGSLADVVLDSIDDIPAYVGLAGRG